MLLYGRSRAPPLQQFDIGGDMHRLDAPEFVNPMPLALAQKISSSAAISHPRILVADIDYEECEEAQRGPLPGTSNDNWQDCRTVFVDCGSFISFLRLIYRTEETLNSGALLR